MKIVICVRQSALVLTLIGSYRTRASFPVNADFDDGASRAQKAGLASRRVICHLNRVSMTVHYGTF